MKYVHVPTGSHCKNLVQSKNVVTYIHYCTESGRCGRKSCVMYKSTLGHTTWVANDSNFLFVTGDNSYGQTGIGSTVQFASGVVELPSKIICVASGFQHSAVITGTTLLSIS